VIDFTLTDRQLQHADSSFDLVSILCATPAVTAVRQEAEHYFLSVTEPHVALPAILARLREHGCELASLTTRHASLEDVFVTLTGRHLRDDATP
jgi:ABC-2 type transport system ATP-binding protein